MRTVKAIGLTLLLVIVFFGGSFFLTLYARDKGWIQGKKIVEEADAYEDQTDGDGGEGDWLGPIADIDWPYIVPVAGPEVSPHQVSFRYNGYDYKVKPTVDSPVYHGAVAAARGYEVPAGATEEEKENLLMGYLNKLTYDPEQESSIEDLLAAFRTIRDKRKLDSDQYAELLVKYVQSIPYDTSRGSVEVAGNTQGDPRMPIQVLVDGKGDCDEKVMLLATLLSHEGYEVNAFYFLEEKHMSLALMSDADGYDESGYVYVETTGPAYVSEVPREFVGGFQLKSTPLQIPFGDGEAEGIYTAAAVDEVARIVEVRDTAPAAAKKQKAYIENTSMSTAQFEEEEAKYEACFYAENSFRATINADGSPTKEFVDRVPASVWIEKNVWW